MFGFCFVFEAYGSTDARNAFVESVIAFCTRFSIQNLGILIIICGNNIHFKRTYEVDVTFARDANQRDENQPR